MTAAQCNEIGDSTRFPSGYTLQRWLSIARPSRRAAPRRALADRARDVKGSFLTGPDIFPMLRYTQNNSVLMDNMTLQGAFRILDLPRGDPEFTTYPRTMDETMADKWNYELNDGFRVATDLACLAQLVQCLILYDQIFVDGSGTQPWADQRTMRSSHPHQKTPIDDLVVSLRPSAKETVKAFEAAVSNANSWSDSAEFADYLGVLAAGNLEAAVFEISNGYFQTGYSDPVLFAGEQHHTSDIHPRDVSHSQLLPLFRDEMPYRLLSSALMATLSKQSKAFHKRAKARRRNVETNGHALAKVGFHRGDLDEKLRASESVVRHAVASCYYHELSRRTSMPYLPHPLRSRIAEFEAAVRMRGLGYLSREMTRALENARTERSKVANLRLGSEFIQTKMPMFLTRAAKDAQNPYDILSAALEIRESRQGRRFRDWMRALQDDLLRGSASVSRVETELDRIQRDLQTWTKGPSQAPADDSLGVELNLGVVTLTRNIPTRFLQRLVPPRRHLRIFHSTAAIYNEVLQLEPHVTRIFGEAVALSYGDFKDLLAKIEATADGLPEERGRLLRLERRRSSKT